MSLIAFQEIIDSSSYSFTAVLIHGLLGCGDDFLDFAHSFASSLSASTSTAASDWRMVLVDLRNHGRSADREGLTLPHDTTNSARDIANLFKSLDGAWPDVVIGHSLGGKVALQYALSCARGDYGDSAQLPKQVWVLDVSPGKAEDKSKCEELVIALRMLLTLPSPIPSQEWLVDHMINLGFSKFLSEWIGGSLLKKSGEHLAFPFNIEGVIQMFQSGVVYAIDDEVWVYESVFDMLDMTEQNKAHCSTFDMILKWNRQELSRTRVRQACFISYHGSQWNRDSFYLYTNIWVRDGDYWPLLEQPPKGMEIAIVRTEDLISWDPDVVERIESLAKRENDESRGKVSVDVVPDSGHWIYKDQPQKLLEIMTPKITSLVQPKL